jgi:hypothetical protein
VLSRIRGKGTKGREGGGGGKRNRRRSVEKSGRGGK